jgi:hypothetical protein
MRLCAILYRLLAKKDSKKPCPLVALVPGAKMFLTSVCAIPYGMPDKALPYDLVYFGCSRADAVLPTWLTGYRYEAIDFNIF